ncbi:MAG: capsular biosynthesis protein [Rubrivivax sp.]|jgi:capsular polysaccharide transport system permease protein|nr:capsular biosynthesis protein [Rubrivivax sp.]
MNRLLRLRARTLAAILVALPVVLAAVYLAFFAADRYVSESRIAVQHAGSDAASAVPGAALLLAGMSPPSKQEALFVQQYIHSEGLLLALDKELDLRAHYAAERVDLPFRLAPDASLERFVSYYRDRVEVLFDDVSMLLTVRVQAFDPDFAQRLNRRLLEAGERFVNETSRGIAREQLRFAEGELKVAFERVQAAQAQLLAFQSRNRLVDPAAQAQASVALVAELQSALVRKETELKSLQGFLQDDAAQVQAVRAEIAALRAQLDAERSRGIGGGREGERLNALALEFQGLQMQVSFATDAYKLALAAVENARVEATRKVKSLVVVEPPTRPETAEHPRRLYLLATVLVVCVLLFMIVRLVIATIREHQD